MEIRRLRSYMQRPPSTELSEEDEATATTATQAGAGDRPVIAPRGTGTLFGRYVVQDELGRGGMSVVYAASDPGLDRRVALKDVRSDRMTAPHRARLHREAQAWPGSPTRAWSPASMPATSTNETVVAMELIS